MILPDVNVLLYAFREDSRDHAAYRRWLDGIVNGDEAYGFSPHVLASLVRVATHKGIFARPSSLEDALRFCEAVRGRPNAYVIEPGDRHWSLFQRLCRSSRASGNLVPDAWLAALAIEHGCEWITTDRDFALFEGLRWRAPF